MHKGALNAYTSWRTEPATATFIWVIVLVLFAAAVTFYWPGNVSSDLLGEWLDARNAAITVPHGLLVSFIWRWLDMLVPGPSLLLMLQLSIFWYAICVLFLHFRPTKMLVLIWSVALSANPFVLALSGSLMNDIFAGNLALLGFALLISYTGTPNKVRTLLLSFSLFGAAGLVRYQIWIVALAAFAGLFIFDRAKAKQTSRRGIRNCIRDRCIVHFSTRAIRPDPWDLRSQVPFYGIKS
jgi:hypothetical protein